jgi:hypothetical protein
VTNWAVAVVAHAAVNEAAEVDDLRQHCPAKPPG